jgi:hypothetical protein
VVAVLDLEEEDMALGEAEEDSIDVFLTATVIIK